MNDYYICFADVGKVKKHPRAQEMPRVRHEKLIKEFFVNDPNAQLYAIIEPRKKGPRMDIFLRLEDGLGCTAVAWYDAGGFEIVYPYRWHIKDTERLWWAREKSVGIIREALELYNHFFPKGEPDNEQANKKKET